MGEFRNTFCWSFSQAKDFASCPRRFFWQRYGSWGGWEDLAPKKVRAAYRLKQMKNGFSLAGIAVDLALREAVARLKAGVPFPLEAASEFASEYLRRAWLQHKEGRWQSNPKRFTCIKELYYGEVDPEDPASRSAWAEGVKSRVEVCLRNFYSCILPRLEPYIQDSLLLGGGEGAGGPESFSLGGLTVYAVPDFVSLHGDEVWILDWKTGKQRGFYDNQLEIYGLWAQCRHGIRADRLRLNLIYLPEGAWVPVDYNDEIAHATFNWVRESVEEIRDKLVDRDMEKNQPLMIENFEQTGREELCAYCNFMELCNRRYCLKCGEKHE